MGRITNYDKKVWNTYKQALTPKLSVTKGTGVASVSVSDGLKSFANGDLITIGNTYTVTATPSSGYAHSALLINGVVKANPATVTITDNQFSVVAQSSDILFDLSTTLTGCTLVVSDGVVTYEAGSNVIPKDTELTITATASEGYTLEGMTFTINGNAFTNGGTHIAIADINIVATAVEVSTDTLVGTYDFANSTFKVIPDFGDLSAYEISNPTILYTGLTSGDLVEFNYTFDSVAHTIPVMFFVGEDGQGYLSLTNEAGITIDTDITLCVMDTIVESVHTPHIFLVAPDGYLLTHTLVLNSIKVGTDYTELLSAPITTFVWDGVESVWNGTTTGITLDTSELVDNQQNIYTLWTRGADGLTASERYIAQVKVEIAEEYIVFSDLVGSGITLSTDIMGNMAKMLPSGDVMVQLGGIGVSEMNGDWALQKVFIDANVPALPV